MESPWQGSSTKGLQATRLIGAPIFAELPDTASMESLANDGTPMYFQSQSTDPSSMFSTY